MARRNVLTRPDRQRDCIDARPYCTTNAQLSLMIGAPSGQHRRGSKMTPSQQEPARAIKKYFIDPRRRGCAYIYINSSVSARESIRL